MGRLQRSKIGSDWLPPSEAQALTEMARAGTIDLSVFEHVRFPLADVNKAPDGTRLRDGGFTNLVITP